MIFLVKLSHIALNPRKATRFAKAAEKKQVKVIFGKQDQSCDVLCRKNALF